mmetsp:Transcript_14121/g.20604  ORF Transcript_14121/g.20604 Transcript_14121/m.20604 type:complete len:741 (+) Transcript_14121:148-2370(+)
MDLNSTSNNTSGSNSGSSNGYNNDNGYENEENNTGSGDETARSNHSNDDDQEDEGEGNSEDESTSSLFSVPPSGPPPPEEYLEEGSEEVEEESALLSAPRNHSYLPGVTQPLYPMELYQQRHNRQRHVDNTMKNNQNGDSSISNDECNSNTIITMDLAVLEMNPGVFLFPGATIPLRLRHPDWVRYLNNRIDRARCWEGGNHQDDGDDDDDNDNGNGGVEKDAVAIGILTSKPTDGVTIEEEDADASLSDELIGRIGTIAIITSISEQDQHGDQPNNNNNNNNGRQEIAMTALGTCKFRILSRVTFDGRNYDDTPTPQQAQLLHIHRRRRRRHYYDRFAGDSMAEKHMFRVQVIDEDEASLPPPYLRSRHIMSRTNNTNDNQHSYYSSPQLLHHLSNVSPIPKHAWELTWPWKLVSQIQTSISSSSKWHGLQSPPPSKSNHHHNPESFSYRMAINLPTLFSEEEKFALLETSCVITRLRLILKKIKEENAREHRRSICCKNCGQIISYLGDMFTVRGADGTAGAYVNEHGIIHQTITLRNVIHQNVRLYGTPQTKDSWFPGYSWTIANCSLCHNHLGWKFLPVHPHPKPNTSPNDHHIWMQRRRSRRRLSSTTSTTSNNHGSTTATAREEQNQRNSQQQEDEEKMPYFWGISATNVQSSSEETQDRNNNNNNNEEDIALRSRYREVHPLLLALLGQGLHIRLQVHGANHNEEEGDDDDEEVVHIDFENESEGDDAEEHQV